MTQKADPPIHNKQQRTEYELTMLSLNEPVTFVFSPGGGAARMLLVIKEQE
jgi:hypothetical protein